MGRLITIIIGTLLLIAAVAGFVIVPEHKPQFVCGGFGAEGGPQCAGWSRTAYDAARIGSWALLILGGLLVVVGLINYARRDLPASQA